MGYCEFLTGLFEDGRVTMLEFSPITEEELPAAAGSRSVRRVGPGGGQDAGRREKSLRIKDAKPGQEA